MDTKIGSRDKTIRNQVLRWEPGRRQNCVKLGGGFLCTHSSFVF